MGVLLCLLVGHARVAEGVTAGLFGAGAGLEERPPLPPRERGISGIAGM